jgi:hypothetical protein
VDRYRQFKDSATIGFDLDLAPEVLNHGGYNGEAYSSAAAWSDSHREARALVAQDETQSIVSLWLAVDAKNATVSVGVLTCVDGELCDDLGNLLRRTE